ncbi:MULTISPECIES: hypothetical protein [Neisseria]|nr:MULTISPECIES: hypothetical protein [Neisseria]
MWCSVQTAYWAFKAVDSLISSRIGVSWFALHSTTADSGRLKR